ncbi:MAG: glycosyltransferase family 4 protein [Flavobacteriaceae bacterium]|nr:glycosyltransferase family 4 protein [Flavobacteriaceae bacterium]
MNKSIVIICEYILIPERIGGMDRFFKAYDSALKEKRYNVTWFFKDVVQFDYYSELTIMSANNNGIESYFLEYCSLNNLKYNIVITHFLQPISPFFKKIKKLMNSYIINVDHNPRPLGGFILKKRIKNKIKGILYSKYTDKLVGVSSYTAKHIINDFGLHVRNKTVVVYNGIKTSLYKKQQLDRTQYPIKFVVVSHLRKSKGIQDLLLSLSQIDRELYKNIKVDIYGDGYYKNTLLDLQKELKLEKIISFKGNSPTLNKLLCDYHYLIQPTYMECFSLSILESLASNVPVITTTVGGNLEIITNNKNGYIFEPKDIKTLAQIIKDVVLRRKSISENVNSKIEKEYTLDIMVANHLKLLECI